MKDRIELYFSDGRSPRLCRSILRHGAQSATAADAESAGPGEPTFRWSRGLQSLCLALVRLRLAEGSSERSALLAGGKGSAASTLDSLVHKADSLAWLEDVLQTSPGLTARQRLQGWFERQNSQLNNSDRPLRIFAGRGAGALRAEQVSIHFGEQAADAQRLRALERALADHLGEEPASAVRMAGSLPAGGEGLVGREAELSELHDLLAGPGPRGLQIVAPGGTGKTALAARCLEDLLHDRAARFTRIFAWSFYRQGFQAGSMQPMWQFREAVARALDLRVPEASSPQEKVTAFLAGLRAHPTLVVLDGVEAMLHPAGDQAGLLRDDVLPGLLRGVVGGEGGESFCLLTTRMPVGDLEASAARTLHLSPLRREHTRALLRKLGVVGPPRDLDAAAAFAEGRPLLIRLLASQFLAQPRDSQDGLRTLLAELRDASRWSDGWKEEPAMARMLRSYARWFAGRPELALLQIAALFDRVPDDAAMRALLADPDRVGGLLDDWRALPPARWLEAAATLRERGLAGEGEGLAIEMHPIVHGFFAARLRDVQPEAWRAGHRALYEYFRALPDKELPDTFEEIEPLLRACYHGCQAGEYRRTFEEVALPRVSRGIHAYLFTQLGAVQETRALMGNFLTAGEQFPADSDLTPESKGMILSMVAHCERLHDRLRPGLRTMERAIRWLRRGNDPLMFAVCCVNAIRLCHTAGHLRRGLWLCLRIGLAAKRNPALFSKEPINQVEEDGVSYCTGIIVSLLLACGRRADAEKALAPILIRLRRGDGGRILLPGLPAPFHAAWLLETGRTEELLRAIELGQADCDVHQFEFNNGAALIKGRAWTQRAIETGAPRDDALVGEARVALDEAVNKARNFGRWLLVAESLLPRARWHSHFGQGEDYERDRNQAHELCLAHGFRLIEADLALLDADHQLRAGARTPAKASLGRGEKIVRRCGYHLRQPEVARLRRLVR